MPDQNLNAKMAELMGWRLNAPDADYRHGPWWGNEYGGFIIAEKDWTPLTDIAQAFMVVEKMAQGEPVYDLQLRSICLPGGKIKYTASFADILSGYKKWQDSDTPSEAICKAALEATI
uniref:Phage ABA sandwich domain-containing protein n=1 Tax=viral metagenome TaxID=1070528 RepID=A0A6H2A240_9ZZZZ